MESHLALLGLGGLLLLGLVADEFGRRTRLPRVSLLVLCGVVAGPAGFDVIPQALAAWYDFLATVALTMVAFLLGGTMSRQALRDHGRAIITVSLTIVALTVVVTAGGLYVFGVPVVLCLLLAGIATATDPAAVNDVVEQSGAKGSFTDTVRGIVAVDDAWGIIAFSLLLVLAKTMAGDAAWQVIATGGWELFGAIAVGLVIGLPAAYLTGRLQAGKPSQSEALGIVFLCAGLSLWLHVSFLLAGIVAGLAVANLARHHDRPFHEIEHVEWPFMVLFFVLAGATFDPGSLAAVGWIGAGFIGLRMLSRVAGGWAGARAAGMPAVQRRWVGLALTPQAGVALGMALVAGNHFPEWRETLIALTIATTLVFELAGPLLTLVAVRRVGEATDKDE